MTKEAVYRLIHRYSPEKGMEEYQEIIINEQCFNVNINNAHYQNICCTPSHMEELLTGHLALEGLISGSGDIKSIEFDGDTIHLNLSTQCGSKNNTGSNRYDDISCPADKLTELMREHLNSSDLHKQTGGVHIMSLAASKGIIISREDIGRHNAVDKLYGYCLLNNLNCADKIFLSSGRVSHEIIQKLVLMGVKIVVSRAAVTSLAQSIAEQAGITVLGFARGDRFNIYTHPHRITAGKGR